MADEKQYFTVCFEGDIRSIKRSPFQVASEFGRPVTIGIGNAFEESDALREKLEKMERAAQRPYQQA